MSFNGSGTFTCNSAGLPVVTGTTISSTMFNSFTGDVATGLTTCLLKDGTQTATALVPFGSGLSANYPVTLGATIKYTSTAQTITAAGSLTLAHGLSSIPNVFQVRLKCTSAEHNYSINDEVVIELGQQSSSAADNYGVSVVPDATNLNIRFGSQATTFLVNDKTTGNAQSITNASWQIIFRAWVL